jgi:pimeloyl-ACP methyl ester carboxylesterase
LRYTNLVILPLRTLFLVTTTVIQTVTCWLEDQHAPPGQRIDIGGYHLHLWAKGQAGPTIILDHSLGGIEGYFLLDDLAKLGRACIYDRAGYGWSDHSPRPRTSEQIAMELNSLLQKAEIRPPYILIGNSFGSYNVRMYAHLYPQNVLGLVLTDGLHETPMLAMGFRLRALKFLFVSGFVMSIFGSILGLIRWLSICGCFELLKPGLRRFSQQKRSWVKRSFCRPKHWITMSREMLSLDKSAQQLRLAKDLGALPIVNIKAGSFFRPSLATGMIPLRQANQLREEIHQKLQRLSTNCQQLEASRSDHFVWIDQPEIIVDAVKKIIEATASS